MSRSPAPGACCSAGITGFWWRRSCGSWSLLAGNFPGQAGHREGRVPDLPDLAVCAGDPPTRYPRDTAIPSGDASGDHELLWFENAALPAVAWRDKPPIVIGANNYRAPTRGAPTCACPRALALRSSRSVSTGSQLGSRLTRTPELLLGAPGGLPRDQLPTVDGAGAYCGHGGTRLPHSCGPRREVARIWPR